MMNKNIKESAFLPLCGGGCPHMRGKISNYQFCYFYKEIIELVNYTIGNMLKR